MQPSNATRQFAGLVLVPVLSKRAEELTDLLKTIAAETNAGMRGQPVAAPIIDFAQLEKVHFARFVLIEKSDLKADPAVPLASKDEDWPLLAFSTNYDGPEGKDQCREDEALRSHIDELVHKAGPGLERVFSCCRGYREGRLPEFLRRNQRRASTFYVGASGRSRNQILWEASLRRDVARILDAGNFGQATPQQVRASVLAQLASRNREIPTFPAQPELAEELQRKAIHVGLTVLAVSGALMVAAVASFGLSSAVAGGLLLLTPLGLVVLHFHRLERNDPQFQPRASDETVKQFVTASDAENEFFQNQLTHLVQIKPGPLRWLLIRGVFAVLDVLARNVFNKGKLGEIPSIHFARWVLIKDRGVLFFSNFDSSWQSYLGDFIDQASSGLTAVWSNTVGYPHTKWLVRAGSRDASRFLAWTRHHQLPTQVWYSAYPDLSIVNINANTEIRRGLADPNALSANDWLFQLRGVDRVAADATYGELQTLAPSLRMQDIQGIILWGYGHLPEARYLMLRVERPSAELLAWLAALDLSSASGSRNEQPPEPMLNVAFSHRGLRALGVDSKLCESFSTAFVQGPDDPYRARSNGDVGADAPENWAWGSKSNPVDLVLLVYGKTPASVDHHADELVARAEQVGLTLVARLEGTTLADRKEHFGFRDGIAQPMVAGSGRGEIDGNTVAAGEFLLGHQDGYGNVAPSLETSAGLSFGTNGSYLVFRQLEQDVHAFWKFCNDQPRVGPAIRVASKMVGRWPSGAPLVRHPDRDPEDPRFMDEDAFSYLGNDEGNDRYGARCPFSAHIRRSNPRDWQLGQTPDESLELSNLHRILRRGRPYGPPVEPNMSAALLSMRATEPVTGVGDRARRGLQFLCFNANLDRQFEFIQHQWCNNPNFASQASAPDPVFGAACPAHSTGDAPGLMVQSDVAHGLVPRADNGMQRFVRVVGSGYFFMPSIPAVKLFAADLAASPERPGLETIEADEDIHVDNLIANLREKMRRDYEGKKTLRDAHPKMHGCVRATFRVAAGLPAELRVGLFAKPQSYDAWVRLSNASGEVQHDDEKDIRGLAIKLIGVPGTKLMEGAEQCQTHDLLLISHDRFFARSVAEFDAFTHALVHGKLFLIRYLIAHPGLALKLLLSLKHHSNLLDIQYFSVVPYLFGTTAVKYTLRPSEPGSAPVARKDYWQLRNALKARLSKQSASFDFMVQRFVDHKKTPTEDASVAWSEHDAPFVKVATLEIPVQEFDTAERRAFGENLSFNPWRALAQHRPLGGLSRARRRVYRALSGFRHDRNAAPNEEPTE